MTRLAIVDGRLCNPRKCALECIKNCPVNKMRQKCVYLPEDAQRATAIIDERLCTGCSICVKKCPFHAIDVINLVAPVEDKLVYSYGENAFKLYGLALPRKGVIAIIGENGCGKSTNVKLLAGELAMQNKPTVEIKDYFKAPKTLAVKPQELHAAGLDATVGASLEKADETRRLDGLKALFDLEKVWKRKLSELSGGELQKVALTATLCKNREVYILDEPFAFLDYVYRIRLVDYLKTEFAEQSAIVVDHDISLLSYMCSQAHILYGHPGACGIVSQSYATDRGINMFLAGFIDPENVRFRDHGIAYKQYAEEKKKETAFTITPAKVTLGSFSVENTAPVVLKQGEVIGVAGPNGIGKSTLCRTIHETHAAQTAFKPQILDRGTDLVAAYLEKKNPFDEGYIRQMNLQRLEYYPVAELSGGELQKLQIFRCLTAEGKALYILDEPTNMMDINGRIALSKLLREKAATGCAVLVVDHDLEFLLNTVDRLLVMDGEPAKRGTVQGVYDKDEGVRMLLEKFDLSYRRDPDTKRLKLNKRGSVKDRELKESGAFIE
ncbi:ribosome biogenesis/translation initiation ATPase RLI [Candidatus Micrarchaeota archaeon CG_4_10_14_0_2_um_filter_60_11]|nr:MAG: hypothetical protein AUJ16_00420 [Candidatus Micrarchaeota archaeon CG1_02_60_51]PIN96260.1 MAG: ribosome biogenesis/translation initiation ATPase RLI [Candidatus Micrarchaeota archaeon CG10_big_fil_rev_8_21_14_0_10_60_32]PIO02161.1 MAG: ribosome biogenesis/translation initiation ATPase RLI [Candidatus Micrarchaeota archaeon CG09_land_8_20_14_0_10_60_16]PIY91364.1 MAG: ribosome biogenesis/translation initiation ATPase RLI [Candidatus Micrarchaeota archaeon CG_4_10_14_0_8_um_filter_60_7]